MATSADSASPLRTLSRLRRNKGANASQQSLDNSADDSEATAQRSSVEQAIDKVRGITRDRGLSDASTRKRLSALVPERIRRARKDDRLDAESTLNVSESGKDGIVLSLSRSNSDSSMRLDDDTRSSSLYTVDQTDEQGNPIRPPLSPHNSHTGYLTLSSPELSASTRPVVTDTSNNIHQSEPSAQAPIIPHIIEPVAATDGVDDNTTRDQTPDRLSGSFTFPRERSRSPARRLKSAFALARKKSLDKIPSADGDSTLERHQTSSRRNSVDPASSELVQTLESAPIKSVAPSTSISSPSKQAAETAAQDRGRSTESALPPPSALEAPQTLVTPPTPTDTVFEFSNSPKNSTPPFRNKALSSVDSIRHRRAQSATLPSRLSSSIPAPLTPTIEEAKTPGGTLTQPTSATGFFSSFFSAAQKAADQLNTTINASVSQGKGKNASKESVEKSNSDNSVATSQTSATKGSLDSTSEREKAVYTLGTGNLSLSHLGISNPRSSSMSTTTELQEQSADSQQEYASRKIEEEAAARAVSVAYEKPIEKVISQATGRPLSVSSNDRLTSNGDQTPPPRTNATDVDSLKRSGSVRSKLSGRRRKHRNSSTTNTSITAALQASATGLASLQANGPGHRLTGFAVASSKRNKDFHGLFRSVPEDDYLIEDYSAALQRDILLHGRLYVSEGHVCFSSNILGWVTNLVIGFDEIVSVEKKSTAVIFPNAIVIQTLHARNTFASFVARDSTYELLIGIWKINHPNLKSSLNGVTLDNAGTGDKTEIAEPDASEAGSADGTEDEVYDEDEEDVGSFSDAGRPASIAASEPASMPSFSRKPSATPVIGSGTHNGIPSKGSDGAEAATIPSASKADLIGPSSHGPSECGDTTEHYDKAILDATIPAPLGKVYSLMWGPESSVFMRKWLIDEMKSRELNYAEDKFGLDNSHKTVVLDYIKPLNAPIGPKQTKCITTNTLVSLDLEKSVSVDCSSSTPDVPSGNAFVTKTRYCLMWGPNNSTRLLVTFTLEWSGKSWIKGAIEKGAQDGQTSYVKDLVTALKAAVSAKPASKTAAKKGRRKGKTDLPDAGDVIAHRQATSATERAPPHWGFFEPLHPLLEPILDLVRPFVTSQVVIAVMFVLLAYTWFVPPQGGSTIGKSGYASPDRLSAYDELWQREENDLWNWLEDRVGVDGIYAASIKSVDESERQRVLTTRSMGKKLDKERMKDRQLDDAIRTTEARLQALKEAVERKRSKKAPA